MDEFAVDDDALFGEVGAVEADVFDDPFQDRVKAAGTFDGDSRSSIEC